MKHIKIKLTLIFVFFLSPESFAQKQNSTLEIDSLKKRIEKLEKDLSTHDSGIRSIDYKLNIVHSKAVEAEETAYKTERELWKLGLNWISGPLSILFAIIGFLAAFFGTKDYVKRKAKERIDEHLKDDKWTDALEVKIRNHLAENKLKEDVKILVISKDEDSEKIIKNYFQENKFNPNKIKYRQKIEIDLISYDFDILFINNIGNTFTFPDRNSNQSTTVLDSLIEKIKTDYSSLAVFQSVF
ncbi:MAG: hypothetical protein M1445_00970, partial [Bacteroidetes bacterium]|nr:hypothetical protein [Bacteroidota bacterium]